jgi:hydroxymethylpyrimidine/phosphomethylpyrimidine kinase
LLIASLRAAKAYVHAAIAAADTLEIGSGPGPVHHFHALRRRD